MKTLKLVIFFILFIPHTYATPPQVTIGFVIDQFAHHYLEKVEPHMTGGLKRLFSKGVVYNNTYMPHAAPQTGPGHATMSTGVYPSVHGIIGNAWLSENNKKTHHEKIGAGQDKAVFAPNGLYKLAKGPQNIMVDNIADQFVLESKPGKPYKAFTLSHKSRAAIGLANKLGKAIWFDQRGRQFTSSKAYFDALPSWLNDFNKKYVAEEIPKKLTWHLFHPKKSPAYNFPNIDDYRFSKHPFSLIGKPVAELIKNTNGAYDEIYIKTPSANQHLLDLAQACFDANYDSKNKDSRLFLWISLSPLDPLGHYYGPESKETLDMVYHLDWQINQFMKAIEKKVNAKDVLYFVTADHGVMPITEKLREKGLTSAHRISPKVFTVGLNAEIEKKHGIKSLLLNFFSTQIILNTKIWDNLSKQKQSEISKTIKEFLLKQPGIAKVWENTKLAQKTFTPHSINWKFQNHLYNGRSGQFTCKTHPYCAITRHPKGAHHKTPYEYDTHIPLALYQEGSIENKKIDTKVCITQLANTLAKIFNIRKPSASTAEPLPGI